MSPVKKFNAVLLVVATAFTVYMLGSLFYVFTAVSYGSILLDQLTNPRVLSSLWVSVSAATIVAILAVLFGVPTAWMLTSQDFKGKTLLETLLVTIPHAFPPGVVGTTYLLMASPTNPIGGFLATMGISVINTFWAVVIVKVFVSTPFLMSMLIHDFRTIQKSGLETIAKLLGASDAQTFRTITIPLSYRTIIAGSGRAWARAMGEVAGTIVLAGAVIPGVTQTMPAIIVFEAQHSIPTALTL